MRARGTAAIVLGASVWGLFWIPLRYLSNYGFEGLWAVAITLGVPTLIAGPFLFRRVVAQLDRRHIVQLPQQIDGNL